MKKIHFFKVHSRLGLINPPYRTTSLNEGVEKGPDAILSEQFLKQFSNVSISEYMFPLPEAIDKSLYQSVMAEESQKCADQFLHELQPEETQVMIGGDHSITLTTFLMLQEQFDLSNMAYIQFDSHADINLFSTSPTGNFHGIYVRPFVTELDSAIINGLVKQRMKSEYMLYVGNLDLDPEEQRLFMEKHIRNYNRIDIQKTPEVVMTAIEKLLELPHVHVTFDVDMFDHSVVNATGIPAPQGLFYEDIEPFLKAISQHPSLSIDLVEVNPDKEGAKETIEIAQKVLGELLTGNMKRE